MQIVLCQPQIPPNTGNIGRLCVATKTPLHLIHPLGFSTDDATVKRAGLDYWKFLELSEHASWGAFLEKFPGARFHFFSKKAEKIYTRADYRDSDFLVFGSETDGLAEHLHRDYAEDFYRIPMWGPTRSINLGTSVGIVYYEALRQVTGDFSSL